MTSHHALVACALLLGSFCAPYSVFASSTIGLEQLQTLESLPRNELHDQLLNLPPTAQKNALAKLANIRPSQTHSMLADSQGELLYVESKSVLSLQNRSMLKTFDKLATYNLPADVFNLNSLPNATKTLYLDFNGHTLINRAWNTEYNQPSFSARSFSLDADYQSFSDGERYAIYTIWKRVAEDFAPFNINVTTAEPITFTPSTGHVLITPRQDTTGTYLPRAEVAAGIAYFDVFGEAIYPYTQPAFIYSDALYNQAGPIAETISHEFGHNLGLQHDGDTREAEGSVWREYYKGHGSGNISWASIMGGSEYRNVTQWSKGEYDGANNAEDDLAIIKNKLSYRSDDHGDNLYNATSLFVNSDGSLSSTNKALDSSNANQYNQGIIEQYNDRDFFTFSLNAKTSINLIAKPEQAQYTDDAIITDGSNLDIKLSLYDHIGNLIQSSDPLDDVKASIQNSLSAGTYFLSIDAVENTVSPYTRYASLGHYYLSGNLGQTAVDNTPDTFSFTRRHNVAPNTSQLSNGVTVSGINTPVEISIDNGEYSINEQAFTNEVGTIQAGDTLQLKHTSQADNNSVQTTTITVGAFSAQFTTHTSALNTQSADTTPDHFTFAAKSNVTLNSTQLSETITIQGIDANTNIQIENGEYSLNGQAFTNANGSLVAGDTIQIRHTSSNQNNSTVATVVTVGDYSASFSSTTTISNTGSTGGGSGSIPLGFLLIGLTGAMLHRKHPGSSMRQ